jgi:glycine cleavage system H protein
LLYHIARAGRIAPLTIQLQRKAVATFRYLETHEYLKEEGGSWYVGLSDFAQKELGDITFVELPEPGREFRKGDVVCTVESVKAVGEVYAPVSLKVVEGNSRLDGEPELVNADAQGSGWLIRVELLDESQLDSLMDQSAYDAMSK